MAQERHDAVIKRLIDHYQNNVLEPEPNPKFEEVKRLLENPETFEEVVAEGLNRKHDNLEIIRKSDVEGSRLIKLDSDLSMVAIEIPGNQWQSLKEKLGIVRWSVGTAFRRRRFDKDSHFHDMNVVILNRPSELEHEESHIGYNESSRPPEDINSSLNSAYANGDEKKAIKLRYMHKETSLLKEILANGPSRPASTYSRYVEMYAQNVADWLDGAGLLQSYWGNSVPGQKANEMVRKEAKKYFERKFEAGVEAIRMLHACLTKDEVTRIVRSCGPTREEIESGNYVGPVKELAEWAENGNYKKVLASIISENVKWVIEVPHNPAGT